MKLKLVKGSDKPSRKSEPKVGEAKASLDDEVEALFKLPLAEFTAARNTLSARLKKNGRGDDAAFVKALAKPPVSAWAVNQVYWNHREAFNTMLESGQRFHKSQKSGTVGDIRAAVDARRDAITHLSDLATRLLQQAGANPGQNPSLDIVRRINSTLEAISAMSVGPSSSDAPRPGRLTHDVDPPGFESLASWIPTGGLIQAVGGRTHTPGSTAPQAPKPTPKPSVANTRRKVTAGEDARRQAKITQAKVTFQDAKKSLTEARARAQRLEAAQKKADAEVKKAEKLKRDAEEEWRKARIAAEDAARRARSVALDAGEATKALENAERAVDKAAEELEALIQEGK